jgi:hypothetical protein
VQLGLERLLQASIVILELFVDRLKSFLRFFLSNDRLTLARLESLDHAFIVALDLLTLVLLLLHLYLHELNLLLRDGLIFLVLVFETLVLVLDALHVRFELLNTLRLQLGLFFLLGIESAHLCIELGLERFLVTSHRSECFLGFCELAFHGILGLLPFRFLQRKLLLGVCQSALRLEQGLVQLLDFLCQVTDLGFILSLGFNALARNITLGVFELLYKLFFACFELLAPVVDELYLLLI